MSKRRNPQSVPAAASMTPEAQFDAVMNCTPAIDPATMERLAGVVCGSSSQMAVMWRSTAVLASKDGSFFRSLANDPEAAKTLCAIVDPLVKFAKHLREMADLAEGVADRTLVACCAREEVTQWLGNGRESAP